MTIRRKIMTATPLICLTIYLLLGYVFGLWHPGWTVFFLIPAMPFILGLKKIRNLYAFICAIIYVLMGIIWGIWHPGWIIFLTIPVVAIFTSNPRITIYRD